MSRRHYTVTCLARHGIGPEVMGAASRALGATSRLHDFDLNEEHVPFGADAVTRFGRSFPVASRREILAADAVLVAARRDDALAALEADLDLRASIFRVGFGGRAELSIVSPLSEGCWEWTLARAVALACESRGRITLVGVDERWRRGAEALERRGDGVEVERLESRRAARALVFTPERFDVLVCPPELAGTAADIAATLAEDRIAAWGRLAATPPGIFGADHGAADELAGHDVADPSSMLLAASLMLGEGLGERSAAATLAGALGLAGRNGSPPSTRQRADVVLAQLPFALRNAEFYGEAACG